MILSPAATEIINRLEAASFEAFAVGGAVRDLLMGKSPNDFDVATNARSAEIKALFSDKVVIPTGEKHGTVTVLCGDESVEVTTFRADGQYDDARHPSAVTFVGSIDEDLSRRDFTVNAIAYNDGRGIIDLFDGVGDIERRVIRAIGEPQKRFSEDALRIMRCIRFASVLGFSIEKKTDDALRRLFPLLENVSVERIFSELKLFLMGDFRSILESHQYIFEFLFPNWTMPAPVSFEIEHDILTRLAFFFSEADKETANSYLLSLKSDNATRLNVLAILEAIRSPKITSRRDALYFLSKYGFEVARRAVVLRGDIGEEMLIKEASELCYSYDRLNINGSDILLLGYRGTEIKRAKERLLRAVIDGEVENEKGSLLKFLTQ